AVIVIATNASQFRERRNSGNGWSGSNGSPQTVYYSDQPSSNTYTSNTNSQSSTSNNCQSGQNICCNNQADGTTAGRRKRNSGSNNGGWNNGGSNNGKSFTVTHSQTGAQHTCYNQATSGASGSQTTGCSTNQSCCQGNTSGGSVASISCSSVNLGQ
ncbi:unnamed protein product, partial [Adineta steineri]